MLHERDDIVHTIYIGVCKKDTIKMQLTGINSVEFNFSFVFVDFICYCLHMVRAVISLR